MKYLIATDIHGSYASARKIVDRFFEIGADKLILLGDLYYHGPRNPLPDEYAPMKVVESFNSIADKIIAIKGNCDAEIDETISNFKMYASAIFDVNGKKIMFTHGQNYNKDCAPACEGINILVYGHFHINNITENNNITYINIASSSLPKENSQKSYAVMNDNVIEIFDFSDEKIISYAF